MHLIAAIAAKRRVAGSIACGGSIGAAHRPVAPVADGVHEQQFLHPGQQLRLAATLERQPPLAAVEWIEAARELEGSPVLLQQLHSFLRRLTLVLVVAAVVILLITGRAAFEAEQRTSEVVAITKATVGLPSNDAVWAGSQYCDIEMVWRPTLARYVTRIPRAHMI